MVWVQSPTNVNLVNHPVFLNQQAVETKSKSISGSLNYMLVAVRTMQIIICAVISYKETELTSVKYQMSHTFTSFRQKNLKSMMVSVAVQLVILVHFYMQ